MSSSPPPSLPRFSSLRPPWRKSLFMTSTAFTKTAEDILRSKTSGETASASAKRSNKSAKPAASRRKNWRGWSASEKQRDKGDFPIHDLLRIRVQADAEATTVRLGGRVLMSTTDRALKGTGRVVRQFVSKPNPYRVMRLKDALQTLRRSRENAFFGTTQYLEYQARESVRLLDAALESAKAFVVQ